MTVAAEDYHSANLNLSSTPAFTDLENWRLKVEEGAQTWHYMETDEEKKAWPQTLWDRYHLGLPLVKKRKVNEINLTMLNTIERS